MIKRLMLPVCLLFIGVSACSVHAGEGVIDTAELFSERDLEQDPDLTDAEVYSISDGQDIHITESGCYVLQGEAENTTVYVEAGDEDKVQLVLDGISITNQDFPCIYVKEADKVFLTTVSDSSLSVTGNFVKDGDTNTDGAVFSRSDLTLNGSGELTVVSSDNGIVCKDDLAVTGGSYNISASSKAFEANDSIRAAGGEFHLKAGTDALHAENDNDDTLGYICILDGVFDIEAGDDGIHGTSVVQIDGGTFRISAGEGIEGTCIQINGGTIDIESWDDGINGAHKSDSYRPVIEINGGDITVVMGSGDTDAIDCNGDLIINGGNINVTASSGFDYDGEGRLNGGTVIWNGQQLTSLSNQMGMGMGMGNRGGMKRGRGH